MYRYVLQKTKVFGNIKKGEPKWPTQKLPKEINLNYKSQLTIHVKIYMNYKNATDSERIKNIVAGSDLMISSLTFICIAIAPIIKMAIPTDAGKTSELI